MRAKGARSCKGFTLLEVLVALLVFSLLASAAVSVTSQYVVSQERVRDKTLASWLASNVVTELRLKPSGSTVTESHTTREFANQNWEVQTTITDTSEKAMHRVEVRVSQVRPPDPAPKPVYTLSAFIEDGRQTK